MSSESPLRDGVGTGFQLIETLGWTPSAGFSRLERHLARLAASAGELGFSCDEAKARRALQQAVAMAAGPQRLRLTLDPDGAMAVAAQDFAPLRAGTVWTARIAAETLDSTDPLLRHKTSRRGGFERARAEFPAAVAQEVLLCNERGEVCEGTITTIFLPADDGLLLTPPLSRGLLEGVLRAELIATGRAREAEISLDELRRPFLLGNSLRGLIPARLG
jgi:4-amino-4-deoxychorismate lyase